MRDPLPFVEHCKRTPELPCPCASGRAFADCCRGLTMLLEPRADDDRRRLWLALMLCWFPWRLGRPDRVRRRVARLAGRSPPHPGQPCWLLAVLPASERHPDEPVVALDRLLWLPWRDGRPLLRCLLEPGQSMRRASSASTDSARRTGTRQATSATTVNTTPTAP